MMNIGIDISTLLFNVPICIVILVPYWTRLHISLHLSI